MTNYLILLLLLIFFRISAQTGDSLLTKVLTPAEMQADFNYLRRLLEETHPGLYRYTSKTQMQAKMDSIDRLIHQPMGFYDFYRTIEGLIADIRCAHTHSLPLKNWSNYYSNHTKTLPFFLFPIQNRAYVLFNGTYDQRIQPGFELISINGQSMERIRKEIYRHHWDDGFIESSKSLALQGQLFGMFYYTCIARPDTFQLAFRDLKGDTIRITTAAQTFVNHQKAYVKNPVNKQMVKWYNNKRPKKPWRLVFMKDLPAAAYLRFDSFSGEGAKNAEEARERFRRFMDASMVKIQQKKTQYLIIDVRSNNGGWDAQGVELFTYLMKSDSAVRYYQRLHSSTDSSEFFKYSDLSSDDLKNIKKELQAEPDGTFTLKENENPDLKLQYPKPNRFRGKVYILMDGRSFSTTAEFTAVSHSNKVGTFVGEETGGAYEGGNGSSFIHLELPNSKIQVGTPLVSYQNAVQQPNRKGRGTLPDYPVSVTLESLLQHTDVQLEFVKELIKKENR